MSNSYKKTPIFPNTGGNPGWYKKWVHQTERARVRTLLKSGEWEEAQWELCPYNDWDDPRDGRIYRANFYPRSGFGIHHDQHRWMRGWTKEDSDIRYAKALRK